MDWRPRVASKGCAHLVCAQDSPDSCGIACLMMVDFRLKYLAQHDVHRIGAAIPAVGEPVGAVLSDRLRQATALAEEEVWAAFEEAADRAYGGAGMSAARMPSVLRALGLGDWRQITVAETAKIATADGTPAIARIRWPGGGAQAPSGHFVVVDGFHGDTACVLDSWDGEVHLVEMENGKPVTYRPLAPPSGQSAGASGYPVGVSGSFSGELVFRA